MTLALRSQRFDVLDIALEAHGGLTSADDLVRQLRDRAEQPISLLARWIVGHEVIAFDRFGATVIPAFLLDASGLSPNPAAVPALRELRHVLDEWETIAWFMDANPWLDHVSPVLALRDRPADIAAAARVTRFASRG